MKVDHLVTNRLAQAYSHSRYTHLGSQQRKLVEIIQKSIQLRTVSPELASTASSRSCKHELVLYKIQSIS